jgi:hypothetical protein
VKNIINSHAPSIFFFDIACSPNICYVTRGKEIIFFAVEDIQAGEEVCISYVSLEDQMLANSNNNNNHNNSTDPDTIKALAEKRRANLSSLFFFECDCRRCAVELGKVTAQGEVERHRKLIKMMLCGKCGCYGWFVPQLLSRAYLDGGNGVLSRTDSKKVDDAHDSWICEACGREERF